MLKSGSRLIPLFVAMLIALVVGCSDDNATQSDYYVDNTDYMAWDSFSFRIGAAELANLRLYAINGDIDITGVTDADSVLISGRRIVRSESVVDAQEHLQHLEVVVQDFGTEVLVRTIQPDSTGGREYSVDYDIAIPEHLKIVVSEANGIVAVDSLSNDVLLKLANGQINISELFGSANAEVANGGIDCDMSLPPNGAIDLNVVNGDIALTIPKATSAEFSATIGNGSIEMHGLEMYDQHSTEHSLEGTLGQGEGHIRLNLINGSIWVFGS